MSEPASRPVGAAARGGSPPLRLAVVRLLVVLTLVTGTAYLAWRWAFSVNWPAWWIAVPLVLAETFALVDAALFGLTMWRSRPRGAPPPPLDDVTVDVFVTTYDEPIELVLRTAAAAQRIRLAHSTWILDDGDREEMRLAAERIGVGYLRRTVDWVDRPRHAKAGNLNNALMQTDGEFLLVLDADQVPDPAILERTLGWFRDDTVALVQTPQWFGNVPPGDPYGSQAPLFYGPILQGKDGWNAAFFCGSNAVLRREALMQLGIVGYVRDVERTVRTAIRTSQRILARALRTAARDEPDLVPHLREVAAAADHARAALASGKPVGEVTWTLRRAIEDAGRGKVADDLAQIRADLADLPIQLDEAIGMAVVDEVGLARMADRDTSPLVALASVQALVEASAIDRGHEAQPLLPVATVSVTEDMATCMRLHGQGWRSVYHDEVLAVGLAPEDLGSSLQQRLRWAQGTLQVMLRENPLLQRGLSWPQRLMYFGTMWNYLSGPATLVFLVAPVLYLCFGVLPVQAYGWTFLLMFLPYVVVNQLLFLAVGWGRRTWRGQQYSIALFPLWIRAMVTVAGNVWLGRPLGFVVTPKTRQVTPRFAWRLVWPQLLAIGVLLVALAVGVVRIVGGEASGAGVAVNAIWVAYDLAALSVVITAARRRASPVPITSKEKL